MRTHAKALAAAAAMVFVLAGMAQAESITVANYSFEEPANTSFEWAVSGWGNVVAFTFTPSDYYPMGAADGTQAVGVNGGGVSQTTNYVLNTGDFVTLKMAVGWSTSSSDGSTVYALGLYGDAVSNVLATSTGVVSTLCPANTWADVTITYKATEADAGKQIGIRFESGIQALFDNVRLSVGLTGDTDGNGVVDVNDLNNVYNNLGTAAPLGDTDSNGVVDVNDLNNVYNNLGTSTGAAGGEVPEPATLSMLALGWLAAVIRRRK